MTALNDFERIETGFAVLYRSATVVYKLRKPLRVRAGAETRDLRTVEARRSACEQEARLNDLLTPDLEYRVVPVIRASDDSLTFDERRMVPGESAADDVVDWALRMRRLADDDRGDRRLAAGTLDDAQLDRLAHRLAMFHEHARGSAAPGDPLKRLRQQVALRLSWLADESRGSSPSTSSPLPAEIAEIEGWQTGFLERHAERFRRRAQSDSIRVGHGELGLDHVFVSDDGDLHILAGLEMMGAEFRDADVAADIALLSSDLAAHRRADLAERFVAAYAGAANDFDLYPLLDFYASLRATQRGKLEWLAAERADFRGSDSEHSRNAHRARARAFFKLALAAPRRPLLPPSVVAMGGQVASGKSTVARHIGKRIGAPVVSSDATRDFLLGSRLNEDLHEVRWERAYEDGFGERVYGEVLRRAGEVLASGRPVVIDGCFRSSEQRERARALAREFGHPFLFVEANVPRDVQHARLAQRAVRDRVAIEVWTDIADELRAQWQTTDTLAPEEHLRLDTSKPLDENADAIEMRIATWPEDLVG